MESLNVKEFVERYFHSHHCVVSEKENGLLEIALTEEMDKKIMNRPFYWHYRETTNQKGVPETLRLRMNGESHESGIEPLHFGSPRFQQIIADLTNKAYVVRAYEYVDTGQKTALNPWLIVNVKISYMGKQTRDDIFSLGLHLITGKIIVNMMEQLEKVHVQSSIAPLCYPLSPMITYTSGFKRIEHILDVYLEEQQHDWAIRSLEAMEDELQLIHTFYEDDTEERRREIEMIQKRYHPIISFKVISGGTVYLTNEFGK